MQSNELNENLCQSMGHKIRLLDNTIDKYYLSSWEKEGMEPTRMQCATLHYLKLHADEDVFQKDLEAAFAISGATATNILKVMEKEGLITRIPMKKDARLKKLQMTEKGARYNEAALEHIRRLEHAMGIGFTEEEITRFRDYLDRLIQNIVDLMEEDTK